MLRLIRSGQWEDVTGILARQRGHCTLFPRALSYSASSVPLSSRIRSLKMENPDTGCRGFSSSQDGTTYNNIIVEKQAASGIAIVRLNRPKSLNALSDELCEELSENLCKLDADDSVRAIILTGCGKAFAAGADIKQMLATSYAEATKKDLLARWNYIQNIRKPLIAAVNGYALGGGCELAMICDIILASENAKFGQPEIRIGTIPGMGGSQRLVRAVGKSRAMEWILTGRQIEAQEACDAGLVSRVVNHDSLEAEAVALAEQIAQYSLPIIQAAKECVNRSFEGGLQDGLLFERRLFHSSFATADRTEGMTAFTEKRSPQWQHK